MQDYSLARRAMVDSQLRPEAVTDRNVLAAMGRVERERFVPESARALAYFDRPVRLGDGRAMMPPAALGRLLSELAPQAGERALVVGSGTGYAAAVLKAIGLEVVAVEADQRLAEAATAAGIKTEVGPLADGWAKRGPYDVMLLDGAFEDVPTGLVKQLAPNGRLAGAFSDRGVSRLVIGSVAGGSVSLRTIVDADVAPLPGFSRPQAFTFSL
ncbi:protein-L-isoaspartate O-methyltransferase family protein [Sphingomonas edaphi]|uniref:Protein-L-isoaspartate O-methyltransferase n=1 Tax=Sphingomonas edaphi TaxID=2315689 RepID=A0A418Q0G5_9SPHN|nr:protein-L-isoaspartate O-methyltransferase [Sphingomonas edaphi]RIX29333.1 protein-L-isoaspartate O-methyltransferase [Sphingomonas edaphi]